MATPTKAASGATTTTTSLTSSTSSTLKPSGSITTGASPKTSTLPATGGTSSNPSSINGASSSASELKRTNSGSSSGLAAGTTTSTTASSPGGAGGGAGNELKRTNSGSSGTLAGGTSSTAASGSATTTSELKRSNSGTAQSIGGPTASSPSGPASPKTETSAMKHPTGSTSTPGTTPTHAGATSSTTPSTTTTTTTPASTTGATAGSIATSATLTAVPSASPGESSFDPAKHHAIVEKLLAAKGSKAQKQVLIREDEIKMVLNDIREVFMSQDMLLEITPPIKICGDIHGQFYDLMRIFDKCGFPPQTNYLFLGDYVDRGKHSVETIVLLFCYKCLYRETFFLLRGNHECAAINKMYGFFDDIKRRYTLKLFKHFTDVFNTMPVACSISDKILCMHGGLSPEMTKLDAIQKLNRPCDVPDRGLICDLLWADPDEEAKGYEISDRGVSYIFGDDVVGEFLDEVDMDLIVRAHQVMEKGYGFFASRQLVTLFSAPNYCGEFDNDAAVMNIDDKLQCSFLIVYANA